MFAISLITQDSRHSTCVFCVTEIMESILYHLICHEVTLSHMQDQNIRLKVDSLVGLLILGISWVCWLYMIRLTTSIVIHLHGDVAPWLGRSFIKSNLGAGFSLTCTIQYRHQSCYESVKVHG